MVKCGITEIDGYAFGSGLEALKSLYDDNQSLRGLIPPIANLIRNAVFRPRYNSALVQPDGFSLSIRPLAELADLFHTRMATVLLDRVYALLGMSSDDPATVGLSVDYSTSWATVFGKLVTLSLSPQVSVETWDAKEVAVVRGKGRVLGEVCQLEGDTVSWRATDEPEGLRQAFTPPVSAKPIQLGDVICLLQGASRPTIIRLHNDYSSVVRIAAFSINDSDAQNTEWLKHLESIPTFPEDFLLVWDWHASRQPAEEYKEFRTGQGLLEQRPQSQQSQQDMDMAVRWWTMGRVLESVKRVEGATLHLERSVEIGTRVLGDADNDWESKRELWETWGSHLAEERGGWVPLAYAARKGYERVVWLILQHGGSSDAQDREWGKSAMSWAAENDHMGVVRLLLEKGAAVDAVDRGSRTTPLLHAVQNGHEGVVQQLLEKGASVKAWNRTRWTPLIWAAWGGYEGVVQQLLDKIATVDEADAYGLTPLLLAAWNGKERVVKQLLAKGALLDLKDVFGRSPLSQAAERGHEGIVRQLLDKNAALAAKDEDGRTPLHRAAERGHEKVIRQLLDKGAAIDVKDENGRTPLHHAAEGGHDEVVGQLLDKGAVIDAKDEDGRTPLHHAAERGHAGVVMYLLWKGGRVKVASKARRTPLHEAIVNGHEGVVLHLLGKGAMVDVKDRRGHTPLSEAIDRGLVRIVRQLLAAKTAAEKAAAEEAAVQKAAAVELEGEVASTPESIASTSSASQEPGDH